MMNLGPATYETRDDAFEDMLLDISKGKEVLELSSRVYQGTLVSASEEENRIAFSQALAESDITIVINKTISPDNADLMEELHYLEEEDKDVESQRTLDELIIHVREKLSFLMDAVDTANEIRKKEGWEEINLLQVDAASVPPQAVVRVDDRISYLSTYNIPSERPDGDMNRRYTYGTSAPTIRVQSTRRPLD